MIPTKNKKGLKRNVASRFFINTVKNYGIYKKQEEFIIFFLFFHFIKKGVIFMDDDEVVLTPEMEEELSNGKGEEPNE